MKSINRAKNCRKALVVWAVLLLSAPALGRPLAGEQPNATKEEMLYFKDLYQSRFNSIEQAEKAREENPDDQKILREYANFYYILAAPKLMKDKESIEQMDKAFKAYLKLWKKNFSNPRIQILMANAYASQGANPSISMETLIDYVFRARNLYSMVAGRYPENLEARLGRARINMNLTPATGRPDAVHREDIAVYLQGYAKLPAGLRENDYYKMGLMEIYLARAMMAAEKSDWEQVDENLNNIDFSLLHEQAQELYRNVKKKLPEK